MTKLRTLFAFLLIALIAFALAACGGDDDGGESDLDPEEVLRATFGGEHQTESGIFGMTASVDVPGDQGGGGELSVSVPFNSNGEGEVPDVELSADASFEGGGESFEFSGGGTITPEGGTINFNDTDYEVPAALFDQFALGLTQAAEQQSSAAEALGLEVDPERWFTNLSNEGTEELDGAEVVHIAGDADITAIGEDLIGAVEQAGIPGAELPPGFDASQLSLFEGFVDEASLDVYSQTDDNLLRRLDVTIVISGLAELSGGQGPDGASFEISVTIDEPNEEQSVELPTETEPFADLQSAIEEEYGVDLGDLGALGGLGGAAIPGLGGGGASGGGGSLGGAGGGGGGEDVPGVNQAYLDCIEGAKSPEELAQCAEDL